MSQNPPKQVAIFGAGIAGLTVAHELVERGFDVDRVFVAAAAYDLCPHAADLPDAPLTATSGARAR